jgi:hypothetical protein
LTAKYRDVEDFESQIKVFVGHSSAKSEKNQPHIGMPMRKKRTPALPTNHKSTISQQVYPQLPQYYSYWKAGTDVNKLAPFIFAAAVSAKHSTH